MGSFDTIPEELIQLVVRQLDVKDDQSTIRALRGTNRRFHRLSSPQLYVAINCCNKRYGSGESGGMLQNWAWKIAESPQFAHLIRALRIYDVGLGRRGDLLQRPDHSSAMEKWMAALRKSNLSEELQERMCEQLKLETAEAHMSFILAMCTRIEVVDVSQCLEAYDLVTDVLLRDVPNRAQQSQIVADKHSKESANPLREFHLTPKGASQTALKYALRLLCFPRLQNLSIIDLSDSGLWTTHDVPAHEEGYRNFNPIALKSDMCMICGKGLGRLLAACVNPESLVLRWRPGLWNEHLTIVPVGDAIRAFGTTLKRIHLDTTDVLNHQARPDGISLSYGSFSTLKQLHRLALPMHAFEGFVDDPAAMFPASLEELYLLGVGKDMRYVQRIDRRVESDSEPSLEYSTSDEDQNDAGSNGEEVEEERDESDANENGEDAEEQHRQEHNESEAEHASTSNLRSQAGSANEVLDDETDPIVASNGNTSPYEPADSHDTDDASLNEASNTEPTDLADDEVVDRIVTALFNSPVRLPRLKTIVRVPWKFYSFYDHGGRVRHRCVSYDSVEGMPLTDLSGSD